VARHAGLARALEVVLTGRLLDARAAYAAGLVVRVVPRLRLEATALALARRTAALEPALARAARRCARAGRDLGLGRALALERRLALGLQGAR
jgi:enoyl-CoA hydratase